MYILAGLVVQEQKSLLFLLPIRPGDHGLLSAWCLVSTEGQWMPDQLGKMLWEQSKSDIHPLTTALLGKLFCACFLFDLHHSTDDPVTDVASSSFALFVGLGFFFPSYDMQNYFSLMPIIYDKGLLLPEVVPRDLAC